MKIVIAFLIVFVTLVHGVSFSDAMYNGKVTEYKNLINKGNQYRAAAKKNPRFKDMYLKFAASADKQSDRYKKELANFQKNYKDNPKKVVDNLYKEKKARIERDIKWYGKYKHVSMYTKRYNQRVTELNSLEGGYKKYLDSFKTVKVVKKSKPTTTKNTIDSIIANGVKNGTLQSVDVKKAKVVSLLDVSKKTQANTNNNQKAQVVELKSSNLNTATSLNNVNVDGKAKANVGGVSIGEEGKE